MTHRFFLFFVAFGSLAASTLSSCACENEPLPNRPAECDSDGRGCLPDESCVEGTCQKFDNCVGDADCPSAAYRCTIPARVCEIRPGFGVECFASTDCEPGNFCALGRCRAVEDARPCARRTDCPLGQACDQQSLFCIEEAPCTLIRDYPEVACDPGETCDDVSGRCRLECQNQCTVATEATDCGVGLRCDGACRCVQCLNDLDCGAGLVCNARAGRCESENLCYSDDDCQLPLVCRPETALCQVPPPPCDNDLDCAIAEVCNRLTGACELPGGACIDDRFEDADTPATARAFDVPTDGTELFVDELQLCPDDDDVYEFALLTGQSLVVRIDGTAAAARATMWLLDEVGETSLRFSETPPFGNGTVSYAAQKDETVYLRISALLGPTPYDMALSIVDGTPCVDDDFEFEGNDTPATATPEGSFPLATSFNAGICPNDVDHYALALAAGEAVDVNLVLGATAGDLDVKIVDLGTGALLAQSSSLSGTEEVRMRTAFARMVGVVVRGFGNSTGAYTLTIDRLPKIVCEADVFEPDNVPEAAQLVDVGTSVDDVARTLCVADADHYRVPLLDFERVVARATFAPTDVDVKISIFDVDGVLLRESPNAGGAETVSYDATANMDVIVRFSSLANTSGDAAFTVFRENQLDCSPDPLEPNNSVSAAAPIPTEPISLTLCDADQDYFSVVGVAGKRLVARATFLHADGDIDLMLLGTNGTQIVGVSDGIGNTEELNAEFPVDGVYTLRVFSLTEGPKVRYDLEVAIVDSN